MPFSASVYFAIFDFALLLALLLAGVSLGTAGVASILMTSLGMFVLQSRTSLTEGFANDGVSTGYFLVTILLTAFLRAGVLAWMTRLPGSTVFVTALVGGLTTGILISATAAFNLDVTDPDHSKIAIWQRPVAALLIYAMLLRLIYLGLPELVHEEAYYWNYSRHLAFGYLDHPPMVAWIIRAFTSLLGNTELGVRAGAFFSWLVGGWFVFKLARCIYDQATAVCAVLLFAVLPAYFLFGFIMTPDAPLYACWAGVLYFVYRALIDGESSAWLGAGIFFGAGLLSKYTIVLLGCSILLFMLADPRSRRWFRRTPPYRAAGIALLLFSPVIVWNFQHDWISFVFQASRPGDAAGFNLPALLGYAAALLTPVGLAAVAIAVVSGNQLNPGTEPDRNERFVRGFRLLLFTTLIPLSVFVFFSLFRFTKLNWTGPLWIGMLPFMARMMVTPWGAGSGRWRAWLSPRLWRTTVVVLLLVYGAGIQYLVLGLANLPYPQNDTGMVALGWNELATRIETVVERVADETGQRPLVVGMEGDRLSSWLAFYRSQAMAGGDSGNTGAAAFDTAGPHLFGSESHMYRLWFPASQLSESRPLLLVADNPRQLDIDSNRQWAGPVREVAAEKNGHPTWRLFYRVLE